MAAGVSGSKIRVVSGPGVLMMGDMPPSTSFVDSRDFARIARAIRYIDREYRDQPRLAQIAAQADLSEFHFNRLFRRWAGVTPKQYLAYVTGNAARSALQTQPVLDAAFAVGLSGPGRLHDLIVSLNAMTPGELKAGGQGTVIRYGFTNTPFGRAVIASTARGICHLSFVDGTDDAAVREIRALWPGASLEHDPTQAAQFARQIWNASTEQSGSKAHPLKLNVAGTNFQLKVWQALLDLGGRARTTYGGIASTLGEPNAARAVGGAVGSNPIAWLIPCHNVLRKDGTLGGYQWGEDRKRAMLAWRSLTDPATRAGVREARAAGTSSTPMSSA